MEPYLHERQTEYWTSKSVEDYFLDAGFECVSFPLTAVTERKLPFDFIFYEHRFGKLFGFQYKALYRNREDFWPINPRQHSDLQALRPWAYYGLSEMTNARDHRLALHKLRILPVQEVNSIGGRLLSRDVAGGHYMRWGGFVQSLEACRAGLRVNAPEDIKQALVQGELVSNREMQAAVDIFVASFENRRLLHLTSAAEHTRLSDDG